MAAGGTMKKIENCNLAVKYGLANNYSLVGIGGTDIHNGTHTLVLGWCCALIIIHEKF